MEVEGFVTKIVEVVVSEGECRSLAVCRELAQSLQEDCLETIQWAQQKGYFCLISCFISSDLEEKSRADS